MNLPERIEALETGTPGGWGGARDDGVTTAANFIRRELASAPPGKGVAFITEDGRVGRLCETYPDGEFYVRWTP